MATDSNVHNEADSDAPSRVSGKELVSAESHPA